MSKIARPRKTIPFRIDDIMYEKLKIISESNYRSFNAQLELLVENFLSEYEKQNGPIKIIIDDPDSEDK